MKENDDRNTKNNISSKPVKLSRTENTELNIVFGFLNKIVTLFLPFAVRTVFIYTLGAEFLGLNSLFVSILQVLNLTEMGFASAIVYSMYQPIADGNNDLVCALLALYRKAYKIIGLVIVLLGLCIMPFLRHLIKGEIPDGINMYILYLMVLSNTVLSYFLFAYKQSLFMANQEQRFVDNIASVTSVIKSILQIILLVIYKNYYFYLVVTPIFTIVNNLIIGVVTARRFPQFKAEGRLPKATLYTIKKNIGGLMIQKLCRTTRNSLDSIIISAFIGLTATALYNNYFLIITAIHGLLSIFTSSMQGSVGNSVATESVEKNHEDMQKFTFMFAWISGVCTVCLVCVFQPFMTLWLGEEMLLPNHIMLAFCFYLYLLTAGDVSSIYTSAAGLFWEQRWRAVIESIANLVLNLILGKYLGLFGIVTATIISILSINFIYGTSIDYKFYFKNGKLYQYYLNSFLYMGVTTSVCGYMIFITNKIHINGWTGLIVKAVLAFFCANMIYFIVYCKNKYFKASFSMIRRIVTKKTGRIE